MCSWAGGCVSAGEPEPFIHEQSLYIGFERLGPERPHPSIVLLI